MYRFAVLAVFGLAQGSSVQKSACYIYVGVGAEDSEPPQQGFHVLNTWLSDGACKRVHRLNESYLHSRMITHVYVQARTSIGSGVVL